MGARCELVHSVMEIWAFKVQGFLSVTGEGALLQFMEASFTEKSWHICLNSGSLGHHR